MRVKDEVKKFLKTVKKLKGFEKVKFIFLYGSASRGFARGDSDIDICIFYDGDKEEANRFRIKLLSMLPSRFDVQIFQSLPLYVRKEVIKGIPIYVRDMEFLYKIAFKTVQDFEDFKRHFYDYIGMRQ